MLWPVNLASEIHRPRLCGGQEPLWRNGRCAQLGVDPRYALVVDGLSPALAELVRRIDGTRTMRQLVAEAVTAGASETEATGLLADLAAAGLLENAEGADPVPAELTADIEPWTLRCGRTGGELLAQRSAATVEVYGSGRVAIAVAMLLAASGVGRPLARPAGHVTRADIGIGYGRQDIGHPREAAAAEAIRRHRASVGPCFGTPVPEVAVVADSAVHDATLAVRLVAERVPHLAVHVRDGRAGVGPFVLPGRTSCLRCASLHRGDEDPCWPRLAAQLAARPSAASHTATAVAAGMAVEQVLGLLAGSGEPATVEAALDLDPLTGRLVSRALPPHPACGCGAARIGEPQHANRAI
jgi:bacteriocin biosynthesis cyclodehydratase domain-containing protein